MCMSVMAQPKQTQLKFNLRKGDTSLMRTFIFFGLRWRKIPHTHSMCMECNGPKQTYIREFNLQLISSYANVVYRRLLCRYAKCRLRMQSSVEGKALVYIACIHTISYRNLSTALILWWQLYWMVPRFVLDRYMYENCNMHNHWTNPDFSCQALWTLSEDSDWLSMEFEQTKGVILANAQPHALTNLTSSHNHPRPSS